MLHRTLEPEVMDSAEDACDYDTMDHSEVNHVFAADFLAAGNGDGNILDVGTGTAQIPIELCRQHPTIRLIGIDLAEHMLRVGRANVVRSGLADRIQLERQDAKEMLYPDASFDAVISNSIVHHIPDPSRVFTEMVRVVRPGGMLFVRDLMRPADEAELARLVDLYAGNANAHQKKLYDDSLRAALTLDEVRAMVTKLGFDPQTVRQTTDRHWTWEAKRPC